jgi:hypothetical protein
MPTPITFEITSETASGRPISLGNVVACFSSSLIVTDASAKACMLALFQTAGKERRFPPRPALFQKPAMF